MGPAGQLWGPLVSSAFIHIRASLPKIIPAFECGSSISLGFGCSSIDNEWRAWMGAKGVDPLHEGAKARRHKPQAQRRVRAGLRPHSQSWSLRLHHPIAKSLGLQSPKGDPRAEASNPESWTWEQLGDQAGTFL